MAPTIREMATVTVTRASRERHAQTIAGIAAAFRQMSEALEKIAVDVMAAFAEALDRTQIARPKSYPHVDAVFAHRGRHR